jgi:hypothetical protein
MGNGISYCFSVIAGSEVQKTFEKNIHPEDGWFTLDNLPHPILPHIEKWFFRLLDGIREIEYDWRGDNFE